MSQLVAGTFASTTVSAIGQTSAQLSVPLGVSAVKLTATGLDANNTVSLLKSVNNGFSWTVAGGPYTSNQSGTSVAANPNEQFAVSCVSAQTGNRVIQYELSAQS